MYAENGINVVRIERLVANVYQQIEPFPGWDLFSENVFDVIL